METPLAKVRGLGSAKAGTRHWWLQRVSALALLPLTVWFAVSLAALAGADHATLIAWARMPLA
ncbi:MAG TPA: succinate dehydrogenase, hydrophobic membrane anchor protein, partial [Sphingomonadales bacterium]|nr:succinate dehydrogenase, hydrophobic membrane anchor protein [Sphingomonadales bacterium]